VSGPPESALDRVNALTTIEPRSTRTTSDMKTIAGRASRTLAVGAELCSGWQILTVSSGWLGPETTIAPLASERLPSRITAAIIELNARSSNFENACLIASWSCLEQPAITFKLGRIYFGGLATHPKRHFHRNARRYA
jgi:hypothetical protein